MILALTSNWGGDEVYLKPIEQLKTYRSFCQRHQLKQALKGDTQEVYAYFLQQMINKVKACGKQAVLWEGFPNTGAGRILIPKDVLVVAWNTTYNPPQQLVQNGYTIVNAAWIPNYFCPSMNFYPSPKACFNWSPLRFAHWNTSIPDITLPKQTPIAGGQLCFWETQPEKIIPTLETHLPALAEHWWNAKGSSDFKAFQQRMKETQKKLETLLHPISWVVTGLIHQDPTRFTDKLSLRCSSRIPGTIRLTLASDWDSIPHDTICYQKPIVLTQTQVVTAQLYSPEGKKIGYPTQKRYQKIDPCLSYTAFGPAPHKGWNTLPNFDTLQVVRKGYFGQVDHSRYQEIQRHLFYKVTQKGHLDTRPEGLDNAFALEMKGTLHISQTGRYQFCVTNKDGLVALTVDQQQWKGKTKDFTPERFTFDLKKGDHPLCIHYYVQHIQNILNITYY
ncbi:MAG: family 20 glycosylhydrolase [Massilibacteroides sp.]|nr:family 20 glycosylhydrolase [Massilibacteroides sp.]